MAETPKLSREEKADHLEASWVAVKASMNALREAWAEARDAGMAGVMRDIQDVAGELQQLADRITELKARIRQ